MVFLFRSMTLEDDPIELMQGCLFTTSYDGQLRGQNLKTDALQSDIKRPACKPRRRQLKILYLFDTRTLL